VPVHNAFSVPVYNEAKRTWRFQQDSSFLTRLSRPLWWKARHLSVWDAQATPEVPEIALSAACTNSTRLNYTPWQHKTLESLNIRRSGSKRPTRKNS